MGFEIHWGIPVDDCVCHARFGSYREAAFSFGAIRNANRGVEAHARLEEIALMEPSYYIKAR